MSGNELDMDQVKEMEKAYNVISGIKLKMSLISLLESIISC